MLLSIVVDRHSYIFLVEYCIEMKSSPDSDLCFGHDGKRGYGAGDAIEIFQNSNKIGTMTEGTITFKLCLDYGQFDIENDVFKFATTGTDGVCIESLSMDGNVILIGPNRKKPNFWFDGNCNMCTDDYVCTDELIIQNNTVVSYECDP